MTALNSSTLSTAAAMPGRRWLFLAALCGVLLLALPTALGWPPGGSGIQRPVRAPPVSDLSSSNDVGDLGGEFKPVPASTTNPRYAPAAASAASLQITDDGFLSIIVNRSTVPQQSLNVWPVSSSGSSLALPSHIRRVVFEVGTNDEPESIPVAQLNRDLMVIAFEPRPDAFAAMTGQFPRGLKSRLIAIPAAVAPSGAKGGYTKMNVGGHKGCSSLLNMNQRLRRFATHEKKHAKRKSQAIQLRTVEWCTMNEASVEIPVVPLSSITKLVPDNVSVPYVMTDAQGFDTVVISTLPRTFANRVGFLVLECQDLPPQDHTLMLVDGALTCAEQRQCVESWFPHRLEYCWYNAFKVREMNCLYRNAGAPEEVNNAPPKGLKISGAPMNLSYPTRAASKWSCPERDAKLR